MNGPLILVHKREAVDKFWFHIWNQRIKFDRIWKLYYRSSYPIGKPLKFYSIYNTRNELVNSKCAFCSLAPHKHARGLQPNRPKRMIAEPRPRSSESSGGEITRGLGVRNLHSPSQALPSTLRRPRRYPWLWDIGRVHAIKTHVVSIKNFQKFVMYSL